MIGKNIGSTKMVQNIAVSLSDQSVIRPICLQEQIHFELSFKRNDRELAALSSRGREFQSLGAATPKRLSPYPLFDLGTWKSILPADRGWRPGTYRRSRTEISFGARSCRPRNVSTSALQTIRCLMGSQCRRFRIGLMWSRCPARTAILAAAFCTFCSREIRQSGSPSSSALAKSRRETTRARTSFTAASWVMEGWSGWWISCAGASRLLDRHGSLAAPSTFRCRTPLRCFWHWVKE